MVYTILISVVFISELIIAFAILNGLWHFDKAIISTDAEIELANPKIKDVCSLIKEISGQLKELAEDYAEKIKKQREDYTVRLLTKALMGFLLWKFNFKLIKKLRRSKAIKIIGRGLKLLKIIV